MQRIRLECKPPTDRFSEAVRQAQQLPVIKKRKQRNEYFQVDGKAVFVSKMVERLKLAAERDRLFDIVLKNDCRKWNSIRGIYALIDVSKYTAYPVDWTRLFSPIEEMAWGEIRCLGLPFFPQYPVLQFFADFADPIKKIVIECDGKKFHNKQKDAVRDKLMVADGWKVFRVPGSDCSRVIDSPWEDFGYFLADGCEDEAVSLISKWARHTVDGLIWALSVEFYQANCNDLIRSIVDDVLLSRSANGARRLYGAH